MHVCEDSIRFLELQICSVLNKMNTIGCEWLKDVNKKQHISIKHDLVKLLFLVRDWSYPYEASYGLQGGRKILEKRLTTALEAKREEFVEDVLIYAKSLCEELEIYFEPQDESGGSIYLAMEVKMFSYRTKMT
ncbi:hypothetical protein TNCV_4227921 [Trichonephila clavipes]|nr:hypothetical protein TNCV_4227921 [Trichonephila clavipes]